MEIIIQFQVGDGPAPLIVSKSFQESEKDKLQGFIDFNVKEINKLKEQLGHWPTNGDWVANIIRKA